MLLCFSPIKERFRILVCVLAWAVLTGCENVPDIPLFPQNLIRLAAVDFLTFGGRP